VNSDRIDKPCDHGPVPSEELADETSEPDEDDELVDRFIPAPPLAAPFSQNTSV
jgi:hypothetical protein